MSELPSSSMFAALRFCTAALALSATFQAGYAQNEQQAPATTVMVEKAVIEPNRIDRRYVGQIEAIDTVSIQPRVSGSLLNVRFKEGEIVQKGDLLFEIEDTQYKAKVKAAQAQIVQIDAKRNYAETSLKRYERLVKTSSVPQDTVDSARSVLDTLTGEKMSAEADLVMAQDNLNYTRITSPIKGRIGRLSFSAGNYITPQSGSMATVTKMDEVYVRFPLSSKDFLSLFGNGENMKEQAIVTLVLADGKPYGQQGSVTLVDNKIQSVTDSANIWAQFDNPDEKLIPGGLVTVHISKKEVEKMPSVPISAVMYSADKSFVYVLNDKNVVERRDVTLSNMVDNRQFIKSGIKEGDVVVIDGMHKTEPGNTVQPVYSKR